LKVLNLVRKAAGVTMNSFLCAILLVVLGAPHWVFAAHPADNANGEEMSHGTLEITTGFRVPELSAEIFVDKMDGYNLQLELAHYDIIPPIKKFIASSPKAMLEGHAHLYVNGVKIQRVYGHNLHLPGHLFKNGINTITISLNDHNHATWTVKGVELQATLTMNVGRKPLVLNHYSASPILKASQ